MAHSGAFLSQVGGGDRTGKALLCWFLSAMVLLLMPGIGLAASFEVLGDLPGGTYYCYPKAVSGDGAVVVGRSESSNGTEAFVWREGVISGLGCLPAPSFYSDARGVNADGSVIVGIAHKLAGTSASFDVPCLWRNGQIEELPLVSPSYTNNEAPYPSGVSGDGSRIVGNGWTANCTGFARSEALLYENGAYTLLGDLPGGEFYSRAYAISGDGTTVVGEGDAQPVGTKGRCHACLWRNGQIVSLGVLMSNSGQVDQGEQAEAHGVSADGSVVVGWSKSDRATEEAFYWSQETGMIGLGGLPPLPWSGYISSRAYGVSGDGKTIVGSAMEAGPGGSGDYEAFIWTAEMGMRNLEDYMLEQYGIVTGKLQWATAISTDGLTIVGTRYTNAGFRICLGGPTLNVTVTAEPDRVMIDDEITVTVKVTNPNQTDACDVTTALVQLDGGEKTELLAGPDQATQPILPPGVSTNFVYRYRAVEEGEIRFNGVAEGTLGQGGQVIRSRDTQSNQVKIEPPYELALTANPKAICANGADQVALVATLTSQGQACPGEDVLFYCSMGSLSAGQQAGNPITVTTDQAGIARCTLTAPNKEGTATITVRLADALSDAFASCRVKIKDYGIELKGVQASFRTIPGASAPLVVSFPHEAGGGIDAFIAAEPFVTAFGSTNVEVEAKLVGPEVEGKTLLLSSALREQLGTDARTGIRHVTFPETVTTDGQGLARFTISVYAPYSALGLELRAPRPSTAPVWPMSILTDLVLDIKAELDDPDHPGVAFMQDFPIVDNYMGVIQAYEQNIPPGLIWGHLDDLPPNVVHLLALIQTDLVARYGCALPGVITNALDNVPGSPYRTYTCGMYQARVLNFLDRLRLGYAGPCAAWLLNGLDYGPIRVLWRGHQAVVIYPGNGDSAVAATAWDNMSNVVLDPWMWQDAKMAVYKLDHWRRILSPLDWGYGKGSSNENVEQFYPNLGKPYPLVPLEVTIPEAQKGRIAMLIHCPVDVTVTDQDGRTTGVVPLDGGKGYEENIPGSEIEGVLDVDGHVVHSILLPVDGRYEVTVSGYEDGVFSVFYAHPAAESPVEYESIPIRSAQQATFHVDGALPDGPAVVMDDGAIVLPAGVEEIVVPALIGLSQERARYSIEYLGLLVGDVTEQIDDSVDPGTVLGCDPPAGTRQTAGTAIDLVVAAAPGTTPTGEGEVPGTTPTGKPIPFRGCFIATAAYGSPQARQIEVLRQFRDEHLLTNAPGRSFVRTYYRYSPPMASFIARHETCRTLTRWALTPLIHAVGHPTAALVLGMAGTAACRHGRRSQNPPETIAACLKTYDSRRAASLPDEISW